MRQTYKMHGAVPEVLTDATAQDHCGLVTGQCGHWAPPLRYYVRHPHIIRKIGGRALLAIAEKCANRLEQLGHDAGDYHQKHGGALNIAVITMLNTLDTLGEGRRHA
jgi:hypothetical protein